MGASHCTPSMGNVALSFCIELIVRAMADIKVGPAAMAALMLAGYKAEARRRAASAEAPVANKRWYSVEARSITRFCSGCTATSLGMDPSRVSRRIRPNFIEKLLQHKFELLTFDGIACGMR